MKLGLGLMRYDYPGAMSYPSYMIDLAMASGIKYYEGCPHYLNCKCESILAKGLQKYNRKDYQLADKISVIGTLEELSVDDFKVFFQNQLDIFQTNYFDTYLLQALDRTCLSILSQHNIIPFLLEQKEKGVINRLGFSFHDSPEFLEKFLSLKCWDVVQLQLNYYDWFLSTGKENYNLVAEQGLPIIVMGPTKGGLLINNISGDFNKAELCYKFLSTLPNIETVLTGANTLEQLYENIILFKKGFNCSTDDWNLMQKNIEIYSQQNTINCTGCNYCNICPRHIPISKLFKEYNNILIHGKESENFNDFMITNRSLIDNYIHLCQNCGLCEKKCPQHLPVRTLLKEQLFSQRF